MGAFVRVLVLGVLFCVGCSIGMVAMHAHAGGLVVEPPQPVAAAAAVEPPPVAAVAAVEPPPVAPVAAVVPPPVAMPLPAADPPSPPPPPPPAPAPAPAPATRTEMQNPGVVVLGHDRPEYLTVVLRSLLALPDVGHFKVFLSLDDPKSAARIKAALEREGLLQRLAGVWEKPADAAPRAGRGTRPTPLIKISRHFKFALTRAFDHEGLSHAVLLEDDLEPAPDFLALFRATAWLLDADPTLFCVSAWNDNGVRQHPWREGVLQRTDYLPGLGWMLPERAWRDGLADAWPEAPTTGWDHWLRVWQQARGWDCVFPEVPRTRHISEHGTNVDSAAKAKVFQQYTLASAPAEPSVFGDTSYLLRDAYRAALQAALDAAERAPAAQTQRGRVGAVPGAVTLETYNVREYARVAKQLGLYASQPRGTFEGVITLPAEGGGTRFVADVVRCGLLRPGERYERPPSARLVAAAAGVSCDDACRGAGLRCEPADLAWANTCSAMQQNFPCEAGCGHQVGDEIPCYVVDVGQPTYRQCLVADGAPTCGARHRSTRRLCSCR